MWWFKLIYFNNFWKTPFQQHTKWSKKGPSDYWNGKNINEINAGSSGHYYSKSSSSGLSGGAIAGIVIACVVVLVAATVASIMLKKPSPPVDNTTVAELKTDKI